MGNDALVKSARTDKTYLGFKSPRDEKVLAAMAKVDRGHFVPDWVNPYVNKPVMIGHMQTCSEPTLVAFMDDILDLQPGMRVLEIGAGCGYHAAITLHLLGETGHLVTVERIEALAELARGNLEKHFGEGIENRLKVIHGDGSIGYKDGAPFDRIYLTAGVKLGSFNPLVLAEQLNPKEGILLFPEEEGSFFRQTYKSGTMVDEISYYGFGFVPLHGENT
ncbi:MAG: protein-L-isoaspartate O-methyltransferase [bacterium]|nr:protein-L-isoaspartate O-methyltransferase [bacterium]